MRLDLKSGIECQFAVCVWILLAPVLSEWLLSGGVTQYLETSPLPPWAAKCG